MQKSRVVTNTDFYTFKTVRKVEPKRKKKNKKAQKMLDITVPERTTSFGQGVEPSEEMLLRLLKNL
jgi:hypothetical protein